MCYNYKNHSGADPLRPLHIGADVMRVIDMHTHIFPEKIAAKATVATAEYFDLQIGRAHV